MFQEATASVSLTLRVLLSVSKKAWLNMTPSLLQMVHSLKVIQQVVFNHCLPW